MDWMTIEQAAEAAKQGKIPALECSLLHWQQPGMVGYVELAAAMKSRRFCIDSEFCACCYKYRGCAKPYCPLRKSNCCNGKWKVANKAHNNCRNDNYSNASMKAFQEAAAEVCKFIADVLEKEKAKERKTEKKKCEPELRHGDYGVWSFGPRRFIAIKTNGCLHWFHADGTDCGPVNYKNLHDFTKFGNIFDDLKRNSKDLEQFEVYAYGHSNCVFKATLEDSGNIIIDSDNWNYLLEDVVEIHQQLGQIIATAKRQENKK